MSHSLMEAPASISTPTVQIFNAEEFKKEHLDDVLRDIKDAQRHAKPGIRYSLTVTPKRVNIRTAGSSAVHEDISMPGCMHSNLLRGLYRANCPANMEISFDYIKQEVFIKEQTTGEEHRVPITVLVVCFMIPGKRTRALRRKR